MFGDIILVVHFTQLMKSLICHVPRLMSVRKQEKITLANSFLTDCHLVEMVFLKMWSVNTLSCPSVEVHSLPLQLTKRQRYTVGEIQDANNHKIFVFFDEILPDTDPKNVVYNNCS